MSINESFSFQQVLFDIGQIEVGQHLYWYINGYPIHGQVIITTIIVFSLIVLVSLLGNSNLKRIPEGLQNLTEYITEFIRDLAKTQIGEEEYLKWVPF